MLFAIASGLALYDTVKNLGVNTETVDLFNAQLDWRQTKTEFNAAFPILSDTRLLVIDADTPATSAAQLG